MLVFLALLKGFVGRKMKDYGNCLPRRKQCVVRDPWDETWGRKRREEGEEEEEEERKTGRKPHIASPSGVISSAAATLPPVIRVGEV